MWLTRGTLNGERFSLLFFLFYVFLIALGPALLQYGLQYFLLFLFSAFRFSEFYSFFVIFNISLFGFCSALHRSGLQLDLIIYNHCKVSRLISRQPFSPAFFFCLFFQMSRWSKGWKVLGMCCYDYDFFHNFLLSLRFF